jgi:endonuclease/exonuclease/phosphatase family metal-dependent hydrolase
VADPAPRPARGRAGRLARWLCWSYPLALVAIAIAFRAVGERWWLLVVPLYLPRVVFAVPLPLVALIAWRASAHGARGLWLSVLAALVILVWPIGGLHFAMPRAAQGPTMRVISYNVWFGRRGIPTVVDEIAAASPDLIALQASPREVDEAVTARFPGFETRQAGELFLASRWPIREVFRPRALALPEGRYGSSSAWARFTVETPLGLVDLFVTHPYSARDAIDGAREGLGDGSRARILDNTEVRRRQVASLVDAAARAKNKVLIAGDTNLPGLSWMAGHYFDHYRDGFTDAGRGFGYTFPAHKIPWMRIDRILSGEGLRFASFRVGGRAGSDHCPVIAELTAE